MNTYRFLFKIIFKRNAVTTECICVWLSCFTVFCFHDKKLCSGLRNNQNISSFFPSSLFDFFCRRVIEHSSLLLSLPLRFAVIASGCASCPRLVCRREGCGAEFCYHCKQAWHPNQTCDSARQQRAQSLHTHSNHSPSYTQEQGPGEDLKQTHTHATLPGGWLDQK